ncbi:hypothetical protein [Staphylococcus devriesei]|uniref:Staphylococcal protein n=1 Tax=Staphylococcus devriesei TaxID=586733 RepID=A0ABX5I282_9STAP|nr:hypothetical protein [Staphylococcus devriesei]MCE5090951.1 hypothetical protein [Staphylococcus devriesei]MCE5098024.1 hypothetical protein [Staphylococcus devriesei]PNZ87924.1 hypothetical protein CD147_06800 [Staphylococcus devriesei]PTF04042.1 hypothetical protein BUY45_05750 [Staphylococcus devriesei]PTF13841.1 hypothetical protein BUY47_07165 [Staphylococcus devriesei]
MNYMDVYLQHFLKVVIKQNIDEYRMLLDNKLKSIETYIVYLNKKKLQMNKLIDSLSATLENKYIDIANTYNIKHAQEINNYEIEDLKNQLDMFEAYCARIEEDIHRCAKERITTLGQYDIIEQMSMVA